MSDKEPVDAWIKQQKRRDLWQLVRGIVIPLALFAGLRFLLKWLDEKREIEQAGKPAVTYPCSLAPTEIRAAEKASGHCR